MCLTTVSKTYEPNNKKITAYKCFELDMGRYYGPFQGIPHKANKHYRSTDLKLYADYENRRYDSGYHAYKTKQDAFEEMDGNCVCKVLLWDIRAEGCQWGHDVIVAKNMKIIEEVKAD